MLQVVNEFHYAEINNDKATINKLLTDDFTETGERHFVQTPEVINKRQILRANYSGLQLRIEPRFLIPANMFGNASNSLSFVRQLTILTEDGRSLPSDFYYVTYTFEKSSNGLRIRKIERHL